MTKRTIVWWVVLLPAILFGAVWGWKEWSRRIDVAKSDRSTASAHASGADAKAEDMVKLSEGKLSAANLETVVVEPHPLRQPVIVSGRVRYDDTRHVEIRAATDSVVTKVLVKPGDCVEAGQVLAMLSSSEVGTARANLKQLQANLILAERANEWEKETCDNVLQLVKDISSGKPLKELRRLYDDRTLGDYRSLLLSTYARWELAQSSVASLDRSAGVLPERTIRERLSEAEATQANVKGTCEQATFDVRKRCDTARFTVDDAKRRVEIARQHLASLLGFADDAALLNREGSDDLSSLSLVESRAPFAGTIERKMFSVSERAKAGDSLFILADTSRLWIAADLREREWQVLKITPETDLMVESPALPNQKFPAQVYFVGREVSAESNAIPLVATIDNADGLLRPGLFVRVTIPAADTTSRLSVPASSIVEHERRKFVFVRESTDTFRRVDVTTGIESDGLVELMKGPPRDALVVASGAFLLKSELLLESDE